MHDPLAVATFIDPSLVKFQECYVDVETQGEFTAGETVAWRRALLHKSAPMEGDPPPAAENAFHPNVKVALEVDRERFVRMLIGRLTG